jgi:hypothetical protein
MSKLRSLQAGYKYQFYKVIMTAANKALGIDAVLKLMVLK